jgi:hypothetical protein
LSDWQTVTILNAFERPATEERLKAIGPTNASPPALQRALAAEDFASLPAPGPRDWFAVHPELARPLWSFGGATEPPGRTATHHLLAAAGKFEPAGWAHAAVQQVAEPVSSFVYRSFHEPVEYPPRKSSGKKAF